MRVFVTGASGFIGTAVVQELQKAGHQVTGLARSDASAQKLTDMGAQVQRGSIDDLDSLRTGAAASEGVIHLAFDHNFADYVGCCERDALAIGAMGSALEGTDKPLLVTSGLMLLPKGKVVTEADSPDPNNVMTASRGASEKAALDFVAKGVRAMVMRLAPTNHGEGDQGFMAVLAARALEKGESAYIGDGANHWPAAHRLDAASAYRIALEKGAAGAVYHVAAEGGVPVKDIAAELGKRLGLPVASKSGEEAAKHFGWLAGFLGADVRTGRGKMGVLGWEPVQPSLVENIRSGVYDKGDTPLHL